MVILPTGEPSAVTSKKTLAVDMIASRQISETLAGDDFSEFYIWFFFKSSDKIAGHSESQK